MPLATVVVPNFNHARFLAQRLDSILAQTFSDFELLILDDASTDDSRAVISQYLDEPRVTFHPNARNSGSPFHQWNRGVDLAHGKFVWIAESDDSADPEFLATLIRRLESDPRLGLCYCHSRHIDEHGDERGALLDWLEDLAPNRWQTDFVNDGRDECARFFLLKNPILNASAVLFRRDAYQKAGGAPEDMRLCGDWLTWVRLLQVADMAFEPTALNLFRSHSGNVRSATKASTYFGEARRVQREVLRRNRVQASLRQRMYWEMFRDFREIVHARGALAGDVWDCVARMLPLVTRRPLLSATLVAQATSRRMLSSA